MILWSYFFDYIDCHPDMVKYTSERDVTSLEARNSPGIYDLRLCLRVTRHCKIDCDRNGPFVILL